MIDLFLVYSFIKRLTMPFEKWKAFELGIIDAEGNELKQRRDFRTVAERDAYGVFDRVILRLKKILAKLPAGQTKIGSYAAALWLIKESDTILETSDMLNEESIENAFTQYYEYISESANVNRDFEMMLEDGAVNTAGSGNFAGIGVGPDGEPGMGKAAQKKYVKKSKGMVRR